MTQTKKSAKKMFSLNTYYGGKLESLGMVIKDVPVGKEGDGAIVFLTLKLHDASIEAQMPLSDSPSFKKHILALIDQALKLKRAKEATKNFK